MTAFWRPHPDGVTVSVKVQPKSRRPGVQGRAMSASGPCLRIGVNEAAEGGRANRAACAVLGQAIGMAPSAITVVSGQTSRDKILRITGDPAHLTAKLEKL